MSIRVTQIGVGGFDENFSYIVHDLESKQGFVVDPSGSFQRVEHAVKALDLNITNIILTHSHGDHYDALEEAKRAFPQAKVRIHTKGVGLVPSDVEAFADGDTLTLGSHTVEILHTPGHTDDSVCLFIDAHDEYAPQLISGDTVFINGCGRIPRDKAETMFHSLQRVKQLPIDTVIFPGHDYGDTPTDTLGAQLSSNRFLNTEEFDEFVERRFPTGAVQ